MIKANVRRAIKRLVLIGLYSIFALGTFIDCGKPLGEFSVRAFYEEMCSVQW